MKVLYIFLTTILLAPWQALSEEQEFSLSYPRFRGVKSTGSVASTPMPEALKIREVGVPRPPVNHDAIDIDRRARRAAAETASHAIRVATRGNFEVGFWQGMRRAFDRSRWGHEAHAAGFRDGHYDPEAEALGYRLGRDAAEARSEELALTEVVTQFRDLSREPVLTPRPPFVESSPSLPRLTAPALRSVFELTPYSGPHSVDPWRIYRCASFKELYRGHWREPETGFRHWEKQQRRGSYWHQLNADEKGRFRVVFRYEYAVTMAERAHRLRRAHTQGFHEGWHLGAELNSEWNYRQGYHEGYGVALAEGSDRGFHDTFASRYDAAYRRLFAEWSRQPRPEILDVRLADGNDDGVFEPGERIEVRYEIANYGGASAELPIFYGSGVAAQNAELIVELPRRSVIRSQRPLSLSIDAGTPARTDTSAFVELAGDSVEVPFRVAYPLEIEAPVRFTGHDALAGRASLTVGLINRSRRPVSAQAMLRLEDGQSVSPEAPIGLLDPGASVALRFSVRGLEPLDLLAGEAAFDIEASSRGRLQDRISARAPVLAIRLHDPALVDYLLALARLGGSPADVARAHQLTLRRLRADWQRAVAMEGNPYREDRKRGSAETALGDLVSTFRTHHGSFVEPRVFTDLVPEIEALAADLPGAHPFLRRHLKKLARELG